MQFTWLPGATPPSSWCNCRNADWNYTVELILCEIHLQIWCMSALCRVLLPLCTYIHPPCTRIHISELCCAINWDKRCRSALGGKFVLVEEKCLIFWISFIPLNFMGEIPRIPWRRMLHTSSQKAENNYNLLNLQSFLLLDRSLIDGLNILCVFLLKNTFLIAHCFKKQSKL
jgi:hypothetical protein